MQEEAKQTFSSNAVSWLLFCDSLECGSAVWDFAVAVDEFCFVLSSDEDEEQYTQEEISRLKDTIISAMELVR